MTSRERLLGAMYGRPTDRVPVSAYELVGWNPDAWENHEPSYKVLMDAIREMSDCMYMTGPGALPRPKPIPELDAMVEHEAWSDGPSHYTRTTWHTPKGDLSSLRRNDDGIHTTWTLEHLLKEADDIEAYLSIPWHPSEPDMEPMYGVQRRLGDNGVLMFSVGDPICEAADLFEMGAFLVHAITERTAMRRLMDAIHERQMDWLTRLASYDLTGIQFRICGPEYATPPYLGPEDFRDYVTRYLGPIIATIRGAGGYARVHCHGKIGKVLDQIVDAGAQGLDPIEPPPDGDITLGEVKRRYGKELCLFGNIELKELEHSSPARIDELVKSVMDEAKEGGGFVLMPTAGPINVPLSPKTERNYMAYMEAGLRYGQY